MARQCIRNWLDSTKGQAMKFLCKILGHRWNYETGVMVDSKGESHTWQDWMALHGMIKDLVMCVERRKCTRCGVKEEHEIHQFTVEG